MKTTNIRGFGHPNEIREGSLCSTDWLKSNSRRRLIRRLRWTRAQKRHYPSASHPKETSPSRFPCSLAGPLILQGLRLDLRTWLQNCQALVGQGLWPVWTSYVSPCPRHPYEDVAAWSLSSGIGACLVLSFRYKSCSGRIRSNTPLWEGKKLDVTQILLYYILKFRNTNRGSFY